MRAKCIDKHYNKFGDTVVYVLSDQKGELVKLGPERLMQALNSGSLSVSNLALDNKGNIIEK